jgi:isoquinoline 1-oxidoreductase beta subunit
VALHQDESIVGEVAEVSVNTDGIPTVHRVTCVVDCGQVVNPDTVKAQMESSIVHGLGAAMWGEMTFSGGEATRKNFNTYRMLRMKEMPEVDTYIIDSTADPSGIGEAGVPPIAPAVVNALARLTAQRYRTLPLVPMTSTIS